MPTEEDIKAARALLEQEGFFVRQPNENDWRKFGAVVTCNMIAPGLTEKKFVQLVENALRYLFTDKAKLADVLNTEIVQTGPLNVKSYTRVKLGLKRKGEGIANE